MLSDGIPGSDVLACPPHRWRIETPNGPLSDGECRKCGLKRRFHNAMDDGWIRESGPGYGLGWTGTTLGRLR